MKFFLHVPAWLSAAQLPLQAVVLAYVGAGGLAGAAIVGGVMLSPVGVVVQEAVAPARAFVESVVPMSVPSFFPTNPRQAAASLPMTKPQAPNVAAPPTLTPPISIEDSTPEDVAIEATPTPSQMIAPQRSAPAAQSALQPTLAPGQADSPADGAPLQGGPSQIGPIAANPPITAIGGAAPVLPGRAAAAVAEPVLGGSRSDLASDARARATSGPASPRVAIGNANADTLRVATVASPTPIVVRSSSGRASEPPTPAAVPTTALPTSAPAGAATPIPTATERAEEPTPAPTVVLPTQAPTRAPAQAATKAPTEQPKKTATARPTQTAVPTSVPTKVPARPVKETPAPTRAVPTATPVKEKEKEKEKDKEKRATPTPTRGDQDDHGGQNGDNQSSKGHEGG